MASIKLQWVWFKVFCALITKLQEPPGVFFFGVCDLVILLLSFTVTCSEASAVNSRTPKQSEVFWGCCVSAPSPASKSSKTNAAYFLLRSTFGPLRLKVCSFSLLWPPECFWWTSRLSFHQERKHYQTVFDHRLHTCTPGSCWHFVPLWEKSIDHYRPWPCSTFILHFHGYVMAIYIFLWWLRMKDKIETWTCR